MRSIVFGFSRPRKWKPFAALIMWNDKTDYSHAYIKFPSPRWQSGFIYQAAGSATHFNGQEAFEKINVVVSEWQINVPSEIEAYIGRMCLDREGKPYAFKQVCGICYVRFMWLVFGKTVKNPWATGDDETDCIEEVAYVLRQGLQIKAPFDMDSITPKPFHDWLTKLSNIQRVR